MNGNIPEKCEFKDIGSDSYQAKFEYEECDTKIQLKDDYIVYSNAVSYKDDILDVVFFHDFKVSCKVRKTGEAALLKVDTLQDRGLLGSIEDEFEFHEFINLVVVDRPEGAANEFRLGEKITIGLDFKKLDENFDYRLNRCWALSPVKEGESSIVVNLQPPGADEYNIRGFFLIFITL